MRRGTVPMIGNEELRQHDIRHSHTQALESPGRMSNTEISLKFE
jgi:hypothetical protein